MDFRHTRKAGGTPVATFGNDSITAEELKERFAEMNPYQRAGYQTLERKKEYVEGLARFELLAAEAVSRGLQSDPEVVETAKKVMVQKLIRKELDEKPTPVIDSEVADFYEKHKSDYVSPEKVRVSFLFLSAAPSSPDRADKKKKADETLTQLKALPPMDYAAFAKVVKEVSEDEATKNSGGDLQYLPVDELAARLGKEAAAAADALKQVGELSGVVESERGFYILKLQSRQAALNLALDQVKTQVQSRILAERRTKAFAQLLDSLKAKARFQLHDAALAKVELDLKAPTKEPSGPPPGFIPPTQGSVP